LTVSANGKMLIMREFLIIPFFAITAAAAELNPVVTSWLNAQTNIQSWSADFVQTRSLKTLAQPTRESGHVWFAAPNKFRWELGHPAKTIAVRAAQELLIIYPLLKRVERYPLTGNQTSLWRDALALLEAGFPRTQAEMQAQYNIVGQTVKDEKCELTLQPKSAAARRMMPQIRIDFDLARSTLLGTELEFADHSTMRNDFKDPTRNPPIDPRLFSPDIPGDYKIVEPLKKR
jgi:outer membrane lipoprotein-sorting protein